MLFKSHFFSRGYAGLLVIMALFSAGCAKDYSILDPENKPYGNSYAVVVSKETHARADWREVVDFLVRKHAATVVIHEGEVSGAREQLARLMPRHTAFVARPEECGRGYIAEINRLARRLDDDPWLDTQWGVITGSDAAGALRVARAATPLEVAKALATTKLDPALYDEYFLLSDHILGGWFWKKPDGSTENGRHKDGREDVDAWGRHFLMTPDLVVTGARGDESCVGMPFNRGVVRVLDGKLYAFADARQKRPAESEEPLPESPNPKIYFPLESGSAGHVNGANCMVTTMMGANGANQAAGQTVDPWLGRGNRGVLDVWQTLPGRHSFSESFFINQQWMLRDIAALDRNGLDYKIKLGAGGVDASGHIRGMIDAGLKFDPRNALGHGGNGRKSPDRQLAGLLWDMDTVAFYGDPAWRATLKRPKTNSFLSTSLVSHGDRHVLKIEIRDRAAAVQNTTPVGLLFTRRLQNVEILSGREYEPVLADNFILLFKPFPQGAENEIVVEFRGDPVWNSAAD
jgi:zinc protease